ncbi:transposase [Salmonella enterica]|nr:transposase [Salmonella enterica]EID9615391.1 transposase [Salmonella enterica subsp. enterica serovar Poona]EIF5243471.1 transposase [Salmonella enterica]EIK1756136.1 transposase [Salmonella enterica]EIP4174552.1 transposase [Salmonella enterica]
MKCVASLSTGRYVEVVRFRLSGIHISACCSHTTKDNRRSQSRLECLVCEYTENTDINGTRNILAAGHAVLASRGMV